LVREQEGSADTMKTLYARLGRSYSWWESHLTRVDDTHPVIVAGGISLRLWRLYAQAWLVCLFFPILALIRQRPTPAQLLLALAGLAIFVIVYTKVMWSHPLRSGPRDRWSFSTSSMLLMGLVALVLVLSLLYGGAFLWLLVGVSALAGVLLSARSAFLVVMALTLLTLGSSVALAGGIGATDWLHVIPLVLLVRGLGLDLAGLARLADALRELHAARGELARLAVIEERLRMARDLHDLLGQSLSTITLKSELAARLVTQDEARAVQEMREVEQIARQTLREVRTAVAGYRQVTLRQELEGARQLLEAAGIDHAIEEHAGALPVALEAVLAWTVREGITNVIRHSRARWCRISILAGQGMIAAELLNDLPCGPASAGAPAPTGNGLAGLAERVAAHGGQMMAGPWPLDGNTGFRLRVELPLEQSGVAPQEPRS
jgi:two-component system, NarL family, sensor histidine kinase DesK